MKRDQKILALLQVLYRLAIEHNVADHVYVVGGAVRNFVLGQEIKDIDIVLDSVKAGRDSRWFAEKLISVIPKASLATNQYGVAIITVRGQWLVDNVDLSGEVIEIANARKESYGGVSGKGYKPDQVVPATIEEDVFRREFTFNTLLWRLSDLGHGIDSARIIDLTGHGLSDLHARVMRCPSNPDKTFSDDPTRMLRAVKFMIKYGFVPDQDTEFAILSNAERLFNVPQNAVSKILLDTLLLPETGMQAMLLIRTLGLLRPIKRFREVNKDFKQTLDNWASSQPICFVVDLCGVGLPVELSLGFLSNEQRCHFLSKLNTYSDPDLVLSLLRQPGKAWSDKNFLSDLAAERKVPGSKFADFAQQVQEIARTEILSNPELAIADSGHLRSAIRTALPIMLRIYSENNQ